MVFSCELVVSCCLTLKGAVGGQPDVLRSVDMTALAADIHRHSAGASLLHQHKTTSPSSDVNTVVTVEPANKSLESSHTAATTLHSSLPRQLVDALTIPIRYCLFLSNGNFLLCSNVSYFICAPTTW